MIYEVSLYDVRKNSACLIKTTYWKRSKKYVGPKVVKREHKDGCILKFIDLISK